MRKILKKRSGIVGDLVSGVGGLVILVVIILVVVSTLLGANLLSGDYNTSATDMAGNFTKGINNVSTKIPTILLIGAVVLLFGVIVFLVAQYKKMDLGTGGSL